MSIIMNLKRNKELAARLRAGVLSPKELVNMDAREMATPAIRERREKAEKDAAEE